jgi:serine/threonine-protein kinase
MGVVYKARQISLDRVVALKMILAGAHAGTQQRLRFRGSRAAAQLNIPTSLGSTRSVSKTTASRLSLEYVDGRSLTGLSEGLPSPLRTAAAGGATGPRSRLRHQRGIVHRDLKPGNILLTADGTPNHRLRPRQRGSIRSKRERASGDVVGTPVTQAPEQAAGKTREITPSVDIYALGAHPLRNADGVPPFEGSSAGRRSASYSPGSLSRLARNPQAPATWKQSV